MRLRSYFVAAILGAALGCETSPNSVIALSGGGSTAATHLSFVVPPTITPANAAITPAVQVAAQNSSGNADTTYANAITVAIGANPAAGVLSGTLTVAPLRGVATFSNLSISQAASGYTLTASAPLLTSATSGSFTITP
jgi:hypothetical protein